MTLSAEQHAMRRAGIGSSEIAAVAGLDPYRRPIDVFMSKTLPQPEEPADAVTGRNPRRWGNKLQRVVVSEWADVVGVSSYVYEPGTQRHPKVEIALATPDAFGLDESTEPFRICEAKTPGLRESEDWNDAGAPDGYVLQTQWLMGVTGIRQADLCALIGGQDFRIRPVEFNEEMFGELIIIAERFWRDHVLTGRPPPIDGSSSSSEYIRRRFPTELEPMREPTTEAEQLVDQIRAHKAEKEAAEAMENAARNKLKVLVGNAVGIEGLCTFKTIERSGYVVEPTKYRELRLARRKKGAA